jgi:hypothetical protein
MSTLALVLVIGLLLASAALIPFLAERARIHRALVAALALAVSTLGALGAAPGVFALVAAIVIAVTGPGPRAPWALLCAITVLGALGGVAAGGAFIGWVGRPRVKRIALRSATTTLGAAAGMGLALALTALAGEHASTAFLCALPLLIVATSVVGFLFPR